MTGGWGWGGDEAVRHLRSSLEGEGDWKCVFADDMRCMKRRHSGAKGAQIFGGVRRKVKNTMQQWDVAEVCCKEICELHTAVHIFVFVATVPLHHLQILFLHFAPPLLAQPDCSIDPVFSRKIPVHLSHLSKTNPVDFINMHSLIAQAWQNLQCTTQSSHGQRKPCGTNASSGSRTAFVLESPNYPVRLRLPPLLLPLLHGVDHGTVQQLKLNCRVSLSFGFGVRSIFWYNLCCLRVDPVSWKQCSEPSHKTFLIPDWIRNGNEKQHMACAQQRKTNDKAV